MPAPHQEERHCGVGRADLQRPITWAVLPPEAPLSNLSLTGGRAISLPCAAVTYGHRAGCAGSGTAAAQEGWLGLPVEAVAGAASEELARPARLTLNRVQPRLIRSVGQVPGRQLH
jgi:hypothetical protein